MDAKLQLILCAIFHTLICANSTSFSRNAESCGGVIRATDGVITSPSFPDLYPLNKICIWDIIAPPEYRLTLIFTDFDLEGKSGDCEYDLVIVRSKKANGRFRKHGVFCGSTIPPLIISESNTLRVEFSSGFTTQNTGFRAIFFTDKNECAVNNGGCQHVCNKTFGSYACSCYSGFILDENLYDCKDEDECSTNNGRCQHYCNNTIGSYECSCQNGFVLHENLHECIDENECATNNGGCQHICNNTIGSYECSCRSGFVLHDNLRDCKETCNHQITSPHGEIFSPNYPDNYPNGKRCTWLFITKPGHRIKLVFKDFGLEYDIKCAYDFTAAYDGDSEVSLPLGKFCGSRVPHPILSWGNRMYLVFKSDTAVSRKGFKASHTTVCGGDLRAHQNTGHFYSHVEYGEKNYDNKAECDWIVYGFIDQRVKLKFLTFEVEPGKNCRYDYVEIYDGANDSAKSLGKFCGNEVPPEFYSSGNFLMVRFRTNDSVNAMGFSVAYAAFNFSTDYFNRRF